MRLDNLSFSQTFRLPYTIAIVFIFLFLIYRLHQNGPTQIYERPATGASKDRVTNVPNMADSCANALASHVEILKTEYKNLLRGVEHVAVIGFPGHS
jgi:hypothetical protein